MKSIQIKDSYKIWRPILMRFAIRGVCIEKYHSFDAHNILHRSWVDMYAEWWLHNIGYYLTKPFCSVEFFKKINLRCKDVDLEEWERREGE